MTDNQPDTGTEPTTADPVTDDLDALRAEVEKWQSKAQEWEKRAKGNTRKAQELEELQRAQMSEAERAIAEARQTGRSEMAARLIDAEIRAAATGRSFDTSALLALDRSQFLADGDVDTDGIRAWVESNSTAVTSEPAGPLTPADLGQGTASDLNLGQDDAFARMVLAKVGGARK